MPTPQWPGSGGLSKHEAPLCSAAVRSADDPGVPRPRIGRGHEGAAQRRPAALRRADPGGHRGQGRAPRLGRRRCGAERADQPWGTRRNSPSGSASACTAPGGGEPPPRRRRSGNPARSPGGALPGPGGVLPSPGRGAAESGRGAAESRGAPRRASRGRPRDGAGPWPHRGLTGPDEPQPAETAPSAEPAASVPAAPPVTAQPPEPVPAVPRQADPPEAASPPVECRRSRCPQSLRLSPPPEVSPGDVPRPRVPPEQALEEGWPDGIGTRADPAAADRPARIGVRGTGTPRTGLRGIRRAPGPPDRLPAGLAYGAGCT